jgi:signal transduction histidine kinase
MLAIISIAAGILLSYQPVLHYSNLLSQKLRAQREDEIEEQKDYYKQEFLKVLERSNFVLYWDLVYGKDNSNMQPTDVFLPDSMKTVREDDDRYDQKKAFLSDFNNTIYRWQNSFYSDTLVDYPSFEYYVLNATTGNHLTNTYNSIERLLTVPEEGTGPKQQYPFYLIFQYDEDGSLQIQDYSGFNEEQINNLLLKEKNRDIIKEVMDSNSYWYQYGTQINAPANTTFVYASQSEDFFYTKGTLQNSLSDPVWDFSEGGFEFVCMLAVFLTALLALLLPLVKSWGVGHGAVSRVPFEFIILGIVLLPPFYEGLLSMAYETTTDFFITSPSQTIFSASVIHILDYILNALIWIGVLSIIFISVLSLRQVYFLGLRRYIKERTLTGRMYHFLSGKIKKLFISLGNVDLTDQSNKTILKVLTVNFVILVILCSVWVVGIAVLVPYSILLFFILKRYMDDIKKKYAILLDATRKMAEGNLETAITENLGVFEPLKEEFSKVQYGFKKAVEEEMKSQRMKTDLITNVSHDLKTPLTAIITYIDLLKNENITPEERNAYIDTLDMKSQRLKRLIEDLFEVSKVTSNNITLNMLEIDLTDLIKQVLLELDDKIHKSEIEFRLHLPEEKVLLLLDSEKTYRIFENLITNITKYAMPHTRAYIDMEAKEDKVIVILKNVSAGELDFNTEEITERFVRGDQSRNTEGSGLGLAIVKSFVELQGGDFEIQVDGDLFKAIITWIK